MLYKFRNPTEDHIAALENNNLYAAIPWAFNDPFEFRPKIDRKLMKIGMRKILQKHFGNRWISMNEMQRNKEINRWIDGAINHFDNYSRKCFVLCLSGVVEDEIMWAHYSSNREGFAIGISEEKIKKLCSEFESAYVEEFQKSIEGKKFSNEEATALYETLTKLNGTNTLKAVSYVDEKKDSTETIISMYEMAYWYKENIVDLYRIKPGMLKEKLDSLLDKYVNENSINFFNDIIFAKRMAWSYEKEWRFILGKTPLDNQTSIELKLPAENLYIGDKMSLENRIRLFNFCINNNVKTFIMELDVESLKVGFKKITIKEMKEFIKINT